MTDKPIIQKVVVGGVIFNKEGKVLIIQRSKDEDIFPNLWELPSGKKEFLETPEGALVRELKEEVGLEVKIIKPFNVFEYQIEKPTEIRDSTQINYIVTTDATKPILSSEHQAFAWISKDEIDKHEISKNIKKVISEAFEVFP